MLIREVGTFYVSFQAENTNGFCSQSVDGARMLVGQSLLVLPDGTIIAAPHKNFKLLAVDCKIDMARGKNSESFSMFKEFMGVENGFIRSSSLDPVHDFELIFTSEKFGEQKLILSPDGLLCVESLYNFSNEVGPMDEVPIS